MSGMVHIYCGGGKGKTSAAMGLALRCCGGGGRVLVCRFLKNDESGEVKALALLPGIVIMKTYDGAKFSFEMNDKERRLAREYYTSMFADMCGRIKVGGFDLAVADELITAVNLGFVPLEDVLELVKGSDLPELVLTGRDPDKRLTEAADYVSEIKKVKHPFDRGVKARKFIEY